jgi:hypothetical protein
MATLGIFSIRLGRLSLACARDMAAGQYVLASESFRAAMSLDAAATLGGAAERIRWRSRKAVDGRMKPGPIFSIQLPDVKLTIGVTDDGCDLNVEADGEHIRLREDELHVLMFSLRRLDEDVTSIAAETSSAHKLGTTQAKSHNEALLQLRRQVNDVRSA